MHTCYIIAIWNWKKTFAFWRSFSRP